MTSKTELVDPKHLSPRHLTMLAIGGSIGTGLFVTSGQVVELAGAWGALLAFLFSGLMVYLLMESLAELASKFPNHGSFCAYGKRFIHPSIGFALGWNYWLNWAITLAVELATLHQLLQFWFPTIRVLTCALPAFFLVFALNACSVRGFGETEYWISWLKVMTIMGFLALGSGQLLWAIWTHGLTAPLMAWAPSRCFLHGWKGWAQAALLASFAFQGTEMLGIAAGEVQQPEKSVPQAMSAIFWRIFCFYIGTNLLVATLTPPASGLKGEADCLISPFTQLFSSWMGSYAANLMNFILLSAVFSSANSGFYAATRMLKGLAEQGMAPKSFERLNARGAPINAMWTTLLLSAGCFLGCWLDSGLRLYTWLIQASTMSGLIAWVGVAWAHLRFRSGCMHQNFSAKRGFTARFHPWGAILALAFCLGLCLILGFELSCSSSAPWSQWVSKLGALYGPWLIFIANTLFHRWKTRSRWVQLSAMRLQG